MSPRTVKILGALLIAIGWAGFGLTGHVAWLLAFLAGVALILENWIKGGHS